MITPNYKDFYQKALIPIGENDFKNLIQSYPSIQNDQPHWLIALVGELKNIEKEFYCWKVTIFVADSDGSFSWKSPCYSSSLYDCIHEAYKHAVHLEQFSKHDQLYSSNNLQASVS
ncbi:hypothetical protein KDN24_21350 [Bacillus sp. Bva_UNVM-123]|uniref:hypothetical protein n=1 Tax=Bacillus sp. Bva_UNVM-123 TaxID=2829798 RepID=UPI00391F1BA6